MDLKVGSIVKYGDNKRGIIESVFEKTVWISGETIPKTEIKEKIKDVEIGDILILEIDGEVLNEVILAEYTKEEIEGEGTYHNFAWDNIENGKITWGQNQPLEYIRIPNKINNIFNDAKYKPNNIEIPTKEELKEFNQNILDQDLKAGQVVAYADKSITVEETYYRNEYTAGVGVVESVPGIRGDTIAIEIANKPTIYIKEDKNSDTLNAAIYPVKDRISKGDMVTYGEYSPDGEDSSGVVFNVEDNGKKIQVYNKDKNSIEFVNATECELLKISKSERKLTLKLEEIITGEERGHCERISNKYR